jgi:hypothetical protein
MLTDIYTAECIETFFRRDVAVRAWRDGDAGPATTKPD